MKQDKISSSKDKTQEAPRVTKHSSIIVGDIRFDSTDDGFSVGGNAFFMASDHGKSWGHLESLTLDEANALVDWLHENGAEGR